MRVLIALDISEADRDEADATYDEIKDGLAARLETFYATTHRGEFEVRAQLRGMADLTEGWDAFIGCLQVGADGAEDVSGYSERELEEVWIAATSRLDNELDRREAWYEVTDSV